MSAPKRVIGVIPARWGSTRFPGKSLAPICGKPLIAWVIERAQQARRLADVVVATDDERIADVVAGLGARAVMTRPDHPSGTDRIAEAVAAVESDAVVNIQGDEPLIQPALIDQLADAVTDGGAWDMATAVTPIDREQDIASPSVVKCVSAEDGAALYFSRSPIPHIRDDDTVLDGPVYWRHLGIYAYTRSFLERLVQAPQCVLEEAEKLEQLRALYIGGRMRVIKTQDTGIGVDTPEDVPYVESLLNEGAA